MKEALVVIIGKVLSGFIPINTVISLIALIIFISAVVSGVLIVYAIFLFIDNRSKDARKIFDMLAIFWLLLFVCYLVLFALVYL